MILCKKTIIATCFSIILPMSLWAEAPVVDDSENFAMGGQRGNAGHPKYDQPLVNENNTSQANNYPSDVAPDEPALVQDDVGSQGGQYRSVNDSANLIDKVQSLQKEIQELRGQLEVQAHDLKLLQQQQVSFYKDLDSRIASSPATKSASVVPPTDLSAPAKPATAALVPTPKPAASVAAVIPAPTNSASRANPADEQISYLAAYEQIKTKRYDDAITSMQLFVQKYPNGGYTANAQYWLGELYMVKKNYSKALEHFEVVLQRFPSSTKSAASQLKAGYAYTALGNNDEAKKRFQEVVRTYPGTPTARLANAKLESIH